jgi:tetratricopeptide (TPR) repeat protein
MADTSRIDDLRRRVQKDPASIAFAQLAEELRRAGEFQEAVEVCRAGLEQHPSYLSARVTLGRALLELDRLDEAEVELRLVLKSAPENLAALRGLGEICMRRGGLEQALAHFRLALTLAPNDPDLQQAVEYLTHKVEPALPPEPESGLSFDDVHGDLITQASAPATPWPEPSSLDPRRELAGRQIAALEQWLDQVHVARTDRGA